MLAIRRIIHSSVIFGRGNIVYLVCMLLALPVMANTSGAMQDKQAFAALNREDAIQTRMRGNVNIRVANNGNIVLLFDNGFVALPDGRPDFVIRFAPLQPFALPQEAPLDILDCTLLLQDRQVLVFDNSGSVLVRLRLDPSEPEELSVSSQVIDVIGGLALQRQTVIASPDGTMSEIEIERPILRKLSSQTGEPLSELPCTSGGRGASSCGYSCGGQSYNVTCGSGTYACCGCNGGRQGIPYCNCLIN